MWAKTVSLKVKFVTTFSSHSLLLFSPIIPKTSHFLFSHYQCQYKGLHGLFTTLCQDLGVRGEREEPTYLL